KSGQWEHTSWEEWPMGAHILLFSWSSLGRVANGSTHPGKSGQWERTSSSSAGVHWEEWPMGAHILGRVANGSAHPPLQLEFTGKSGQWEHTSWEEWPMGAHILLFSWSSLTSFLVQNQHTSGYLLT